MKKILLILYVSAGVVSVHAQKADPLTVADATRIETYLASDELRGRKPGTPEMEKAADFIAMEFAKSGLKFYGDLKTYRQSFANVRVVPVSASGRVDNVSIPSEDIVAYTTDSSLIVDRSSGFEKTEITKTEDFLSKAETIIAQKKNVIVFVDNFFSNDMRKLRRFRATDPSANFSVLFVRTNLNGDADFSFDVKSKVTGIRYFNVVGVLPGKSRKDEMVVFSGHYDHLGVGKANAAGDSVYNGANDDAAGTTAMIMLAKYYAQQKNNERTLVFVAFTAEESGGFGAQHFSKNINPDKVVAMFNLEMIGTESKWGKNSAYITGFERSDFGSILQKNLTDTEFRFEPDPYPSQNLFYRSDNATLAALGVPAHTISTAKMDDEPHYHKPSDEVANLDLENMVQIIKAVASSSRSIVSGKDTPTRVAKRERRN